MSDQAQRQHHQQDRTAAAVRDSSLDNRGANVPQSDQGWSSIAGDAYHPRSHTYTGNDHHKHTYNGTTGAEREQTAETMKNYLLRSDPEQLARRMQDIHDKSQTGTTGERKFWGDVESRLKNKLNKSISYNADRATGYGDDEARLRTWKPDQQIAGVDSQGRLQRQDNGSNFADQEHKAGRTGPVTQSLDGNGQVVEERGKSYRSADGKTVTNGVQYPNGDQTKPVSYVDKQWKDPTSGKTLSSREYDGTGGSYVSPNGQKFDGVSKVEQKWDPAFDNGPGKPKGRIENSITSSAGQFQFNTDAKGQNPVYEPGKLRQDAASALRPPGTTADSRLNDSTYHPAPAAAGDVWQGDRPQEGKTYNSDGYLVGGNNSNVTFKDSVTVNKDQGILGRTTDYQNQNNFFGKNFGAEMQLRGEDGKMHTYDVTQAKTTFDDKTGKYSTTYQIGKLTNGAGADGSLTTTTNSDGTQVLSSKRDFGNKPQTWDVAMADGTKKQVSVSSSEAVLDPKTGRYESTISGQTVVQPNLNNPMGNRFDPRTGAPLENQTPESVTIKRSVNPDGSVASVTQQFQTPKDMQIREKDGTVTPLKNVDSVTFKDIPGSGREVFYHTADGMEHRRFVDTEGKPLSQISHHGIPGEQARIKQQQVLEFAKTQGLSAAQIKQLQLEFPALAGYDLPK